MKSKQSLEFLMNSIQYTYDAMLDLIEIERYITEEFASPVAAKNTVAKIAKHIRLLEDFPELGALLSSIVNFESEYRFLVCGKYLAFYRIAGSDVHVIRVIYGKRDYLTILFGDSEFEAK